MANEPYKGPINRPCSACSAGDTAMAYHDHDYVDEAERRKVFRCAHCDSNFIPTNAQQVTDDWCYCICHAEEVGF